MTEIRLGDPLDPARARALQAALGEDVTLCEGDALPPFYHQIYFWEPQPPAALGRDGHPRTGLGLIPDLGLPRRMWAGGQLQFHRELRAGVKAERRSTVVSVERKTGRSGPLGFVTLEHEIWQDGALCVSDVQDLVYREEHDPSRPTPSVRTASPDAEEQEAVTCDSTLLFRYSALTMNGHRIHYDDTYAREVEGYPGLVVHGPLLAHLLMRMAARRGVVSRFEFRGVSPLCLPDRAVLRRAGDRLWVSGPKGRLIMEATVG